MSSRVTGAGLALIAVALIAVAPLTPAVLPAQLSLFAGHPTVADHTRTTQDVYVGMYSAQLCNTGGDGTCRSGDTTGGFRAFGYAELGLNGALAASALALALLTLRRSERRKSAAHMVWLCGGLALACAAALIILGPFHGASAPIGIGMVLQAAGILAAAIGAAIAIRPPPPIRLRVAERGSQPLTALPTAQAFNRRAARNDGLPRPGEPGHDPRLGHDLHPPSPAVPMPSPHGGAAHADRPFAAGPQLRPLYDANPAHGGTGGLLPMDPMAGPGPRPVNAAGPAAARPVPPRALAADEPTVGAPPLDEARHALPFAATEPPRPALPFADSPRPPPFDDAARPMPPFGDAARPMPPFGDASQVMPPLGEAPRPMPPFGDASRAMPPLFTPDEPDELHVGPPPPSTRVKPTTVPPPLPPSVAAAAALPTAIQPAHKPRTQVSLVPPMPDNDLPIAPPTAQIATDGAPDPARSSHEASYPRAETPLAPPPPPIRREIPPPRPVRDTQSPRSPALRASVPMPARSSPSPTRPPLPAPARSTSPRPTIATSVPPIPAIPAIPPIPAVPPVPATRRADTDITDPDGRPEPDAEVATVSRVPVEVGDYVSQTNVSHGAPSPDDIEITARGGASDRVPDTSPSGEPVAPFHPGAADPSEVKAHAAAIAARPTIQSAAQPPPRAADQPTIIAPPPAPLPSPLPPAAPAPSAPAARDRPMPKLPISTAPESLPPPRDSKPTSGPSPACPQCEAPMAWVEEHLRFYCKSCRMYF